MTEQRSPRPDSATRRRRRRHRRRRRSRRLDDRLPTWRRPALDVLLLEKTAFPREKVCGDGLTPRAVKQLVGMGIDVAEQAGWLHNQGLRIIGGGHAPRAATGPTWPASRTTAWSAPGTDFDEMLARHAVKAGARLRERRQRSPARSSTSAPAGSSASTRRGRGRTGRRAHVPRPAGGRRRRRLRAGCPLAMGLRQARRPADGRRGPPLLHAARGTTTTTWSPGWSCGTATGEPRCCPATAGSSAWATAPVNVGLGHAQHLRGVRQDRLPRRCCSRWLDGTPGGVGLPRGERGPARSAARRCRWASTARRTTPAACCWSATPAAWSTRSTARASPTRWSPASSPPRSIVQALARPAGAGARAGAARLPARAEGTRYGGYYTLGRIFVKLIGKPDVMRHRDPARPAAPGR